MRVTITHKDKRDWWVFHLRTPLSLGLPFRLPYPGSLLVWAGGRTCFSMWVRICRGKGATVLPTEVGSSASYWLYLAVWSLAVLAQICFDSLSDLGLLKGFKSQWVLLLPTHGSCFC